MGKKLHEQFRTNNVITIENNSQSVFQTNIFKMLNQKLGEKM